MNVIANPSITPPKQSYRDVLKAGVASVQPGPNKTDRVQLGFNVNELQFGAALCKQPEAKPGLRAGVKAAFDSAMARLEEKNPGLTHSMWPGAVIAAVARPLYRTGAVHVDRKDRPLLNAAPPASQNRVECLFGDEAAVHKALDMIKNAKSSVLLETFLLNGGHGRWVSDALIEKAKDPNVTVKVILDPGAQAVERDDRKGEPYYYLSKHMKDNGVEVLGYDTDLMGRNLCPTDHTKMLLIDGKQALTGGTNFDDQNNQDANVILSGPAVREMSSLFHESWQASGGDVSHLPPVPSRESLELAPGEAGAATRILTTDPIRHTLKPQILADIENTKKSLDIGMFAFNEPQIRQAVLDAKARGVEVRALLDPGTNAFGVDTGGMPNQETQVAFTQADIPVRFYKTRPGQQFHSKFMVMDQQKVVVGSTNFIPGAFKNIKEMSAELESPEVAKTFTQAFEGFWSEDQSRVPALPDFKGRLKAWGVDQISQRIL